MRIRGEKRGKNDGSEERKGDEVGVGWGGRVEQEKSISSSSQLPNDALDCLSSCAETEGVRGD